MIIANITDREHYYSLHPKMKQLWDYILTHDLANSPTGRINIDGDRLFVNVDDSEMSPKEERPLEVHRRYIDVQYMISGREKIRVTSPDGLTETEAYHADGDYELFAMSDDYTVLDMKEGDFAILFPGEPHAPGVRYDGETAETVGKVVVKVTRPAGSSFDFVVKCVVQ